ncbi:type II toxin-antitoxin system MqsR family toxin [Duganella sp. HH105]|uniref:type II toxin-antitoxin system MqsR family toxin n=1 Tax=Duganella sp. HH105 TaxID=1781067 RepID=UPI00090017B5|nr:type II toxin-antitoxin system MqsR family toxin [Duganella sp. HH105]
MEKRTPHYRLSVVKTLVISGRVRATLSALSGAAALGMGFHDMLGVVMGLRSRDFYKSMTTQSDHRVWQDVYRPTTGNAGKIYLKLTVIDGVLIVSFKEL